MMRLLSFFIIGGGVAWLFYPGLMSPDALFQYVQVKTGIVNNLHPPLMVMLWYGLERWIEGPAGIYMLYWALYILSATIICRLLFTRYFMQIIGFLVLLAPPVLAIMMTIWKDSLMLASLMFATAALLRLYLDQRKRWMFVVLGAIWFAAALRHNALVAVIPFMFLMFHYLPTLKVRIWKSTLYMLAALVFINQSTHWIEKTTGVHQVSMFPTIAVWDLAAMSIEENVNLIPDYALQDGYMAVGKMKKLFSKTSNVPLCQYVSGEGRKVYCVEPIPLRRGDGLKKDDVANLVWHWMRTIYENPEAYIKHRVRLGCYLLDICRDTKNTGFNTGSIQPSALSGEWYDGPPADSLSIEPFAQPSKAGQMMIDWFVHLRHATPFMSTWFYLALLGFNTLVFLFWQHHNRLRPTAIAIALSGWLMFLPLIIIAPNLQLRYAVWPIVCALLTLLMIRPEKREWKKFKRKKKEKPKKPAYTSWD